MPNNPRTTDLSKGAEKRKGKSKKQGTRKKFNKRKSCSKVEMTFGLILAQHYKSIHFAQSTKVHKSCHCVV